MTERVRSVHPEGGVSRVKQSMRDEVDANRIMEKWITLGQYPRGAPGQPMYGDFTSGVDYHQALNRLIAARDEFAALPSRVRSRCENDPGRFLELCADPENLAVLRELGLAEQDIPEQVVKVQVVPDDQAGEEPAENTP